TAVAAANATRVTASLRLVGKKIHQSEERQILRVGEKETPQSTDARAKPRGCIGPIEPLCDRLAPKVARDRPIPSAFEESVRVDQRVHRFAQRSEEHGRRREPTCA